MHIYIYAYIYICIHIRRASEVPLVSKTNFRFRALGLSSTVLFHTSIEALGTNAVPERQQGRLGKGFGDGQAPPHYHRSQSLFTDSSSPASASKKSLTP